VTSHLDVEQTGSTDYHIKEPRKSGCTVVSRGAGTDSVVVAEVPRYENSQEKRHHYDEGDS